MQLNYICNVNLFNSILMNVNDFKEEYNKKNITIRLSTEAIEILNRIHVQSKVNKSQIIDQLLKSVDFD